MRTAAPASPTSWPAPIGARGWARATTAMIGELVRHYNVTKLFAVAKAANFRSIRLLERLGFVPAGSDGHPAHDVEPDEVLMSLAVRQAPDTSC